MEQLYTGGIPFVNLTPLQGVSAIPSYLVGLSQYHLKSVCKNLPAEDIMLQMKFANFFRDLPKNKVEEMVQNISRVTKRSKLAKPVWDCKIPQTKVNVRYLYKEGKIFYMKTYLTPKL